MTQENDDFLSIDRDRLDEEWVNQPRLYYKYAEMLADARLKHDTRKNQLELVRAELSNKIRKKPEEYGLDKITESVVEGTIILQEEYQDVVNKVNKAKHQMEVIQAVVVALDHKKKALEKLVDLEFQNYHSEPKARKGVNQERMREVEKRITRKHIKVED